LFRAWERISGILSDVKPRMNATRNDQYVAEPENFYRAALGEDDNVKYGDAGKQPDQLGSGCIRIRRFADRQENNEKKQDKGQIKRTAAQVEIAAIDVGQQ